ncbi:hypothetical protein [Saccharothrix longispora]|nr:hypothetical protein [Saccharothrix longispora]MDU0287645.1 hypothetical protein [Saccharothrix longispora]
MALPRYGEDDLPPDAELPVVDGPGHPLPDAVHRVAADAVLDHVRRHP